MKTKLVYLPVLVLGVLLSACEKEEKTEPLPPVANASALDDFFEQYKPATQTFTVNSQQASTITGAQGTVVDFDTLTFESNNNPVTGNVTIELVEAFSRGDMLLLQKPTIANGRLMVSAGEIYLRALQGSNELEVGEAEMRLPQVDSIASNGQMQVYYQASPDEYGFNWKRAEGSDTTAVTYVPADSLGTAPPFYRVAITDDELGWLNISHIFNQPGPGRAIWGQLSGLDNYDGFVMYCVYQDIRAISPFTVYVTGRFSSNISLPDEQNVKLVAFGKKDSKFYYGESVYESGPQTTAPQFGVAEISEADLIDKIRNL